MNWRIANEKIVIVIEYFFSGLKQEVLYIDKSPGGSDIEFAEWLLD